MGTSASPYGTSPVAENTIGASMARLGAGALAPASAKKKPVRTTRRMLPRVGPLTVPTAKARPARERAPRTSAAIAPCSASAGEPSRPCERFFPAPTGQLILAIIRLLGYSGYHNYRKTPRQ